MERIACGAQQIAGVSTWREMPAPLATEAESPESMGIRYAFTEASLGPRPHLCNDRFFFHIRNSVARRIALGSMN